MIPYRRIVVKVGTNVLTTEQGLLNQKILASLVAQITEIKKQGVEVILVSSGAMAAGRALVKSERKPGSVEARQVLAAVGQVHLMHDYSELFSKEQCLCAQVLATKEDFRDRQHYLNMRGCFQALLEDGIVPIVNENDVVSVGELMFTDNDELAGLIASMVDADALILLTSVAGILTGDPEDPATTVLRTITSESDWKKYLRPEKSSFGRGGMHTKCASAEKLAKLGITTHIAMGTEAEILPRILKGEEIGTVFPARKETSSVKRWVAEGEGKEKGIVTINQCAKEVLLSPEKAASLLPVGIVKIDGEFAKGDILRICCEDGSSIGFGIAQYSSVIAKPMIGRKGQKALIHYDYLSIAI
ncbi:MAG: glutamate 5-kinase [Candidatus Peregrinibacteria bacterium]